MTRATKRFLELNRLLPLPWAKITKPLTFSGEATGRQRRYFHSLVRVKCSPRSSSAIQLRRSGAASVLFTAGYTDHLPSSLLDPVASLPLAVFFQLGMPYPQAQQRAYAAAFLLLAIVLLVSIIARLAYAKAGRFSVK